MLVEETTIVRQGAYLTTHKGINYSHCPIKKRPVPDFYTPPAEVKAEEPENLSTKPQDLSIKSEPNSTVLTPETSPTHVRVSSPPRIIQPIAVKSSPGPLEALNLNTHHLAAPAGGHAAWPTTTPYSIYFPSYPHHQYHHTASEILQPQRRFMDSVYPTPPPTEPPYAPRESSPPNVSAFLPMQHHPQTVSLFYPTSPPQDLSSPGSTSSVRSAASSGSSNNGYLPGPIVARKRRDEPASRFQCPDCGKSYSTHSGLSKHQQFHCAASEGSQARAKSFSCKFCDKVYVSLGALKMHIRTHTLPCKCKMCGKAFSRPWLLQGHIRTHTGEKPFSCSHCDRAFADRSNLRAHLQTHSDVKKYSCRTCSKQFTRMSLLSKHTEGGCPGAQLSPAQPIALWPSHQQHINVQ